MKYFPLFFLLLFINLFAQDEEQVENKNQLLDNMIYNSAPEFLKHNKPFVREWVFYQERAYPFSNIPTDAYKNSIDQLKQMRAEGRVIEDFPWVSLGPTPGYYFNYGNISSRIVTGAFNPQNPNIIYIGAANGGVWRSTDGGVQWQPLTDNQVSMAMGAIAIDPDNPDIIYAGTGEATYSGASYSGLGLLKSTDAGDTWSRITSGLPANTYFSRIKIRYGHNNELLAAMGYAGLYRSTDSGSNWAVKWSGRIDDVVFSPSGDTAFAIGGSAGLIRSIDGGNTFASFGTGLPAGARIHFDLCKASPSVMYAAIYSNSGVVTAYKSTDYGANWAQVAPSQDFNGGQAWYDLYCRVNPWNPDVVFIGTIDVYRSTNGGSSFTNITYGYSNGPVHVDQHYLFFHPTDQNTFVLCNDGGIYESANNGSSFTNLNQNLTLTQFYRIAASPFDAGRILGGTQDNGTQETHSTLNWAAAFGGDGGEVCFNPFSQSYIIGETQNGGLTRTTNNGNNWYYNSTNGIDMNENVAWVAPIVKDPVTSAVFYTARQKVYKTTNNGSLWSAVSGNLNGTGAVSELNISKTDPAVMIASSGAKVFLSTDAGVNWNNISTGLPNRAVTSVYIHPENSQELYVTLSGTGTSKVYKSTNQGAAWINISGNLPDSPVNDIYVYTADNTHPNTYFVATDIGVFLSQDDGQNWAELDNGLPNTVVLHLDYSESNQMLRAGTHGRGVYETYVNFVTPVELTSFTANQNDKNNISLNWATATETNNRGFEIQRKLKNDNWLLIGFIEGSGTSAQPHSYNFTDDISDLKYDGRILYRLKQIDFDGVSKFSKVVFADVNYIPETVELFQNYPNPFNPSTTIIYSIPYDASVKLTVYNSLGQKAEELINGVQSQGYHKVVWNAGSLSSGIYIYTLEVMGKNNQPFVQQSKKLILLR